MKNAIIQFLLILFFSGTISLLQAQSPKKVYSFGYATQWETKQFYVSNIINAIYGSDKHYEPLQAGAHNQWHDWFATKCDDKLYNYSIDAWSWLDYNYISDARIKMIGERKQDGFSIHYVNDFQFIQEKHE